MQNTTDMFEPVYTITDYYDGPRGGIAEFGGKPHTYESYWLDVGDDPTEDIFRLAPVDEETVRLACEDWEIFRRWDAAFRAGQTSESTHPALPDDRTRYEELARLLEGRLTTNGAGTFCARAQFRANEPWDLQVEWTRIACPADMSPKDRRPYD